MKIYIASKYIEHAAINNKLAEILRENNYEPFIPASINIDAITKEEMHEVAEICYKEISMSDIILVVAPFGISVSAEIGFSIACNRYSGKPKFIIGFGEPKEDEAMVVPYFNFIVNSVSELIEVLKTLDK